MGLKSFVVLAALACAVVLGLEGDCGDDARWTYNNNLLDISGAGAMWNFTEDGSFKPSWVDFIPQTDKYEVRIHGQVSSIGSYAFYNNKQVTGVQVMNKLNSIGDYSFKECSLTTFTFSSSNSFLQRGYIGKYAFSKSFLTSFAITGSILGIDEGAFSEARNLSSVSITGLQGYIEIYAFSYCSNLSSLFIQGAELTTNYPFGFSTLKAMKNLTLRLSTYTVESGFVDYLSNLEDVSLLVSGIGPNAFDGFEFLKNVIIETDIGSIGEEAFKNAGSSDGFHFYARGNIRTINKKAFFQSKISEFVVDGTVGDIGQEAFSQCSYIEELTLTSLMGSIGIYAFKSSGFKQMTINGAISSIGQQAFSYDSSLKNVVISGMNGTLSSSAFGNSRVESVVISGVKIILDKSAFYWDEYLKNVSISAGECDIGSQTFIHCTNLEQLTLNCNSLASIGSEAFKDCTHFKKISIPQSCSSIGEKAFYGCTTMIYVSIPASVTSINSSAFEGCSALSTVVYKGDNEPTCGTNVFNNCRALSCVDVPKTYKDSSFAGISINKTTINPDDDDTGGSNTGGDTPSGANGLKELIVRGVIFAMTALCMAFSQW